MRPSVLAVDLGGTKIAAVRVGKTAAMTHPLTLPTPPEGGMAVIEAIVSLLRPIPHQGIGAVGIAVPGLAYPDGSVWAPNIRGWRRLPLSRLLNRKLRLPVLVESDRNAFVTGEAWQGAARGCRDAIFLAIGTGIGAGIISGGHLIRGWGELAGCAGWMAVREKFLPAYRTVGCLEYHAAGPGLAREAERVFKRVTSTRDLVKRARGGDRRAKRVLAQAGCDLGRALAGLVDILNPQTIVIGGGVAAASNLLLDPAREALERWAQPLAAQQVRIVRTRLGNRGGLLGAAKLAFDRFHS